MGNLENAVTVASWFDPAAFQPAGHGQLAAAFAEAAVVVVDRQGVDDAAESDVDDDEEAKKGRNGRNSKQKDSIHYSKCKKNRKLSSSRNFRYRELEQISLFGVDILPVGFTAKSVIN